MMVEGGKRLGTLYLGVLAAVTLLPGGAFADDALTVSSEVSEYYSVLERLVFSESVVGEPADDTVESLEEDSDDTSARLYEDFGGGSAGGYVNIGGPVTSTFLASAVSQRERKLLDGIEFGLDWRPDVSGEGDRGGRWMRRTLTGNELDRVGLRADVIALLRDENDASEEGSAWRVSGMLGSTSLSLMDDDGQQADNLAVSGGDFLWDVGVGWSSGAMSLNAGYQSIFSLSETGSEPASLSILSLGADYSLLPGLSLYGEVNMVDRPLDSSDDGFGAVVVVGTGVSF